MCHLLPLPLIGLIVFVCAAPVQAMPASALALDQVQVVDVDHGRTSVRRCVRIEGKTIVSIAPAGSLTCQRQAKVIDLAGCYLMPGLIDMHAHLTLGPLELRREGGKVIMRADPDDAIADHNAVRLVGFGVTTIRNPGGNLAAAARYRARRNAGKVTGPESFDAGPVINDADLPGLATGVATPEDIRRVVAAQVDAGANWIKLYTGLSPTLLQAGITAAHAHGKPVMAHLEDVAWTDALPMGLDGIEHLMPISPDLLEPGQRASYLASRRPGAFRFFEWWEHFNPDGPEADRIVSAFNRYRPIFDATLVAFHAAFVQDQAGSPYLRDAEQYAHLSIIRFITGDGDCDLVPSPVMLDRPK